MSKIIIILCAILLWISVANAATTVDMFCDVENGSIGDQVTTTNLGNATHETAGSWGNFTNVPSSNVTIQSDTSALRGPVSVSGTEYPGTGGTRGIRFNGNTTSALRVNYDFPATHSNVSTGFHFRTTGEFTTSQEDLVRILSESYPNVGDYAVLQGVNCGSGIGFRAHATNSAYGTCFNISLDHTYWVTIVYKSSGQVLVRAYDPSNNYSLVGSSSCTQSGTANPRRIEYAHDNHGSTISGYLYYDNIIIDFADATFPLLPDAVTSNIHWVSPTGSSAWGDCAAETDPGSNYCSLSTANSSAAEGDTVMMKSGTYSTGIAPSASGSSGSPITYKNVTGETPTISGVAVAVNLTGGQDWIVVDGVNGTNNTQSICMGDANNSSSISEHNIIKNGTYTTTNPSSGGFTHGSQVFNANYNAFQNLIIHDHGYCGGSPPDDYGSIFQLGSDVSPYSSWQTSYNLIEDCTFYHAGHHVLGVLGKYNTVRNNYIHNEAWMNSNTDGNRCVYLNGADPQTGYNLLENNRIGYAAVPCDDNGVGNMAISTPSNIVRFNSLYYHNAYGIGFCAYPECGGNGDSEGANNRLYNNTIVYSAYETQDDDTSHLAAISWMYSSLTTGNAFKNNLWYHRANYDFGGTNPSGTVKANNYDGDVSGNPLFEVTLPGTAPEDKTDSSLPNLALSSNSPAKDYGAALTTVSSGCNTSALTLADGTYFQDGTWSPAGTVGADWVAVGTVSNVAQITSRSGNVLNFASAVSCTNGASVWLYKKSDGVQVLYGTAPAAGAYEYTGSDTTAPTVTGCTIKSTSGNKIRTGGGGVQLRLQ